MINLNYKKVGSVLPNAFAGWQNTFQFGRFTFEMLIHGRFGGHVVSNTQAIMDRFGVSAYSARIRETGINIGDLTIPAADARDYLNIIAAGTGQGAHYVYNATNVRLGQIGIHYTIPRKAVHKIADITLGIIGENIAMLYCKAPFDPELAASTTSTFYAGVDYFMQPSVRSLGINIKVQF
jgi:hypothetical protein